MLPYVFLIYFIIAFSLFETSKFSIDVGKRTLNSRFVYAFIAIVGLTLFMGLRSISVGCDLIHYLHRYEISSSIIDYPTEKAFNYFSYFFHDILHASFHSFLFATACVTGLSLFVVLFRYSEDISFSLLLYISIGTFTMALSGVRQTFAMSIAWIAIYFAEKRRPVFFIMLVLLASSFHNSAVIFFISYFLWGWQLSRKQSFLIVLATLSMFFLRSFFTPLIELIQPSKYEYIDLSIGYDINPLVLIVAILIMLFCYFFQEYNGNGKCSKTDSFFFIFSCLNVVFLFLSMSNNQVGRLAYYFNIGNCLLIPSVIKKQEKYNVFSARITKYVVIAFALAYFFISTPGGTLKIDNYNFFFLD